MSPGIGTLVTVRPVAVADIATVVAWTASSGLFASIYPRDTFDVRYVTGLWEDYVQTGDGSLLVAELDGNVAGVIAWLLTLGLYAPVPYLEVQFWAVVTPHRGTTVGPRLLEAAKDEARVAGATMSLTVPRDPDGTFGPRPSLLRDGFTATQVTYEWTQEDPNNE